MRIIMESTLHQWASRHPSAKSSLDSWQHLTKHANWTSLTLIREAFPHADSATVKSGRTVVIFNIAGNNFRLITAVHHQTGKVFLLDFLTHSEYNHQLWKRKL